MNNQVHEKKQNNNDSTKRKEESKTRKKISWKYIAIVFSVLIVGMIIAVGTPLFTGSGNHVEVITTAKLEKIIDISELNTFQAVYNGITKVMNEKKPDKLDYYVSYEAKVNAGFDFDKLEITKYEDEKKIIVTIPQIEIIDVNVDIASLDYMFQNKKADIATVSEQAYKACIADATKESEAEIAIYDLAEQNAKNIIEALISPFIEQFDPEYELEIN